MSEIEQRLRAAGEHITNIRNNATKKLNLLDTDVQIAIDGVERNLRNAVTEAAELALQGLPTDEREAIEGNPSELIEFMANLVETNPRGVTNSPLRWASRVARRICSQSSAANSKS